MGIFRKIIPSALKNKLFAAGVRLSVLNLHAFEVGNFKMFIVRDTPIGNLRRMANFRVPIFDMLTCQENDHFRKWNLAES